MGDNRYNSEDSSLNQNLEPATATCRSRVVGRAFVICWPMNRWSWVDDYLDVSAVEVDGMMTPLSRPAVRAVALPRRRDVDRRVRRGGPRALAGPVAVGMVVIDTAVKRIPPGCATRSCCRSRCGRSWPRSAAEWVMHHAVGWPPRPKSTPWGSCAASVSPAREHSRCWRAGRPIRESTLILDGNYDYLNPALMRPARVVTRIKADRDCASVSAAP